MLSLLVDNYVDGLDFIPFLKTGVMLEHFQSFGTHLIINGTVGNLITSFVYVTFNSSSTITVRSSTANKLCYKFSFNL